MLETDDGLPDQEEQKNYRALIRQDKVRLFHERKDDHEDELLMLAKEFKRDINPESGA